MMRVLHLTLKKKWFDMIASGEKKEEYREIKKYWMRRLFPWGNMLDDPREFHAVYFKNGYSKNAPSMLIKWEGTEVRVGKPEWGAEPGKEYFVIKLGDIIPAPTHNQ